VASVSNDTTVCVGDTISIQAFGGITWAWVSSQPNTILSDTSQAIVQVAVSQPTNFTVTVTDPVTGCFTTGTVAVDTFRLPIVNLGPDTLICEGGNVIRPIPAGFVSYLWSPVAGILGGAPNAVIPNPTLVPTSTTSFVGQATDNRGCRGRDTLLVTVVQSPVALINGVQVDTITMCLGDTLTLYASGGNAHLWLAPFNLFLDSIPVSPTDTFDIKMVASVNGCYSTANDTARLRINVVTPPSASFVSPFNGCQGQPVLVYFDGYYTPNAQNSQDNFIWNFDTGVVIDTVGRDSFLVQWASIDTFLITLVNQLPYCNRSQQSPIEIFSLPVVSAGPDISYCFGLTDTLQGTLSNLSPGNCFVEWQPYFALSNPFDITPITNIDTTSTYTVSAICNGCQGNTDTVRVVVLEQPTAVIDTFLLTFCAGGNVQLPGGGYGGTGNLRYNWFPNGPWLNSDTLATPTVTFNSDTTIQFRLVVTDRITGCVSDTAYIQVISYPNPVVNAGPDKVVCGSSGQGVFLQGTVVVGGFGNYHYQWTPSAFLSNPNTLQPYATPPTTTVYTLTATNLNTGCSSNPLDTGATVTVTLTQRPVAEAGPVDTVYICLGDSVQIGGVPSQVGTNVQYIWSPSQGLSANNVQYPMASPPHTFKYYVQVVSNGCVSNADSIVVAINPLPVFRVDRPYYAICQDDSVTIGGNPLAGPTFQYAWTPTTGLDNPASARPTASPDVTTTYTVTVSSANCQGQIQDTVRVEVFDPPVATIPQNEFILCPDSPDSVQLLVTNVSSVLQPVIRFWTPNDGTISDTSALSPMVKPTQTQFYYLNLVAGACSSRYEFRVYVQPLINAQINVTPGTLICNGTAVTLQATGGLGQATFLWLDNNSTDPIRTVTPGVTTTYTVVVTEGVCSDTATVTIQVVTQPIADFSYTLAAGCDDPSGGLSIAFFDQSTNAGWWAWDFGDGSPVVNHRNPTHTYTLPQGVDFQTYTVRLMVSAPGGCGMVATDSNSIFVQRPGVASFTSAPTPTNVLHVPNANVVFRNTSQRGVRYLWEFGDGQTSEVENPVHRFERPGLYTVRLSVTDAVGCVHTAEGGPYRVDAQDMTIPNVLTPNGDEVNDIWAPLYLGDQLYEAYVYDRNGNLLHSFRKGEQGWRGTNSAGQEMPAGVYFYSVKIIKLNTDDEVERALTGNITLIR
jgi:gliding motility-associated-like protein